MIDKLEMFLALAREQHFGKAADSLGIAQPSLSAGIKKLEGQLGVQLVWRGSRFGGLTPEGHRVLVWARQIVGDTRTMREEMRTAGRGLSGQLRLAVIPTALTVAARLIGRFGRLHPQVSFTMLSRTSEEILAMLDNLDVDGGITYLHNEHMGRVTAVHLYTESYTYLCHEASPLADRDELRWEAIADEKLCLLTPDMQNRRIIDRHFAEAGCTVRGVVESNSTVVLTAQVETSDMGTILPRQMAEFLAAGKPIRIIPLKQPSISHAVGLIAPHRDPYTPLLKALFREAGPLAKMDELR